MSVLSELLVASCLVATPLGGWNEVREISDQRIVQTLAGIQILSEKSGPVASTIRIMILPDRGECDGSPETCPQEELLIAIVELEDPAVAKLFSLGKAYGWEVVRWGTTVKLPDDKCGYGPYQSIVLREKIISEEPTRGWWAHKDHELLVNPACARLRSTQ